HKKSQGFSGMKIRYPVLELMDGSSFVLDNVRYILELRRNLISLGTFEKEGFTVKKQSGKIKAMTRKTLKGRKQLREYQTGWKIRTCNVLDSCNQRSTQQCMKSRAAKHLGVAGLQQQNGLVKETNATLLAKVCGFLIQSGLSKLDDVTSKVVIYRNMGFNESEEYKKTFTGSGVGTISVQVLQGVEFEVEPQEDHTFKQHSTHELFSYREDNNEATFVVAKAKKIYAHESLTFNNTVAYEAEIWVTKGLLVKAKGNILGLEIIRDQSGNTLRVSQSKFYNEKLVQTLLEGYFILSLKDILSGDFDVEKNGKWSCIYAVGSQEYQMVCTRLDIASADVVCWISLIVDYRQTYRFLWILTTPWEYRSLSWVDQSQGTRNRVRIRAKDSSGYCYWCLVKGYLRFEVLAHVEVVVYRY
nr:zinc finger, CCHC-type [Tanacetum cinerariifolium]